jgi:hypothetical protein
MKENIQIAARRERIEEARRLCQEYLDKNPPKSKYGNQTLRELTKLLMQEMFVSERTAKEYVQVLALA